MTKSRFVTLPSTVWVLDATIRDGDRRRALLFPPSFEDTVAGICRTASVKAVKSERNKSWGGAAPLPERVSVLLELHDDKHFVDFFHNSAAGVRAQCLHSVELGSAALDFARDKLREKALQLTEMRRLGAIPKDLLAQSLALPSTKVWIHQGLWVRRARMTDRQLRIAQWEAQGPSTDAKVMRLLRYGSKAPSEPAAIDVIGGWVHPTGRPIGKDPAIRPCQVHKYGFT